MALLNFSRIKQWIGLNNLTAKDLNAEFNNFFSGVSATNISGANGYPPLLANMQATESPGGVGTEVLAPSLTDDVKQLRYMIDQIVGGAQWYSPVPNTLTGINSTLNGLNPTPANRLISGRITSFGQPDFLVPAGSSNGNSVTLKATVIPLDTYINSSPVNFIADLSLTGLTKAPSSGNTCVLLDASQSAQQSSKSLGERSTVIQIGTIGSNILARTGTYCAFQTSTEVFFGELSIANTTGSVTFTNAAPTAVTYTSHPFVTGDQVVFSGGSLPAAVTAGTIYFVTIIDANTFNISTTSGGSFVNTAGTGSGTASVLKSNVIKNCFRGWFFDNNDAAIARVGVSNGATITLLQVAWLFVTNNGNTPALDVTYNKPTVSIITPSSPAIGDYWLDLGSNQWKKYSGSSFVVTTAVGLGIAVTNTADTIAARSFDFNELFATKNTFEVEYLNSTQVRATKLSDQISVYGSGLSYPYSQLIWDTSVNMDAGVSLAASTNYYCYINIMGQQFISDQAPHQRKFDLLGDYHPNKPWRCVATFSTDGSSNVLSTSVSESLYHQNTLPVGLVQASSMANGSVTGGVLANQSILGLSTVRRQNLSPVSQQLSSSCGHFTTTSVTPVNVTNLTVLITTSGRPVRVWLQNDGNSNSNASGDYTVASGTIVFSSTSGDAGIYILRNGSIVNYTEVLSSSSSTYGLIAASCFGFIDTPAAGTYTYSIQVGIVRGTGTINVTDTQLMVYEL